MQSDTEPRGVLKTAAEYDTVLSRKFHCYLQHPGATSGIKRQIRRRERRTAKDCLRDQQLVEG